MGEGKPGLNTRGRGGTSCMWRRMSSSASAPMNGTRPVNSSYAVTASEYWSLLPSTASPRNCSGDM